MYAAGLGSQPWPDALATMAALFNSSAVTLERFDAASGSLREYQAFGVPPAQEIDYLAQYAASNPRAAQGIRHPNSALQWDYQFIDEAAMERDSYYADFLRRVGLRYFVSGQLWRTADDMTVVAVQRTPKQGHVGTRQIALMKLLLPHVRQAFETTMRLRAVHGGTSSLQGTLDCLADGVALVRADGTILYANDALQAIARRGDGLRIVRNAFAFAAIEASTRFSQAIAAAARFHAGALPDMRRAGVNGSDAAAFADFPVPRPSGAPAYVVSLRPLPHGGHLREDARIAVFVRDPTARHQAARDFLRELFGLTPAEAALACAMQHGISPVAYARKHALNRNTVFTHLRRLKEKTGWHRADTLIRKLGELELPARANRPGRDITAP